MSIDHCEYYDSDAENETEDSESEVKRKEERKGRDPK